MEFEDRNATEGDSPRYFYGWVIVAACLFIIMTAYGVVYSFGVFFKPLQDEFEWSRAATSGIFSFYQISHTILGMLAGWANDRYGPRLTVAVAGVALAGGLMLTSQVNALWQLYIVYGLLVGLGISGAWSPLLTTVSRWFTRRRGLALGVVAAGIGIGTLIMSPLSSYLISVCGWRQSYLYIGVAALVIFSIGSIFLRKDPREKGLLPYGETRGQMSTAVPESRGIPLRKAIRTRSLWLAFALFVLISSGIFMVLTHIVRYAQDTEIPPLAAASILGIIGAASIAGRITMGAVSDRIGIKVSLAICVVLQAIVIAWLSGLSDVWEFYLFAVAFGFSYGGIIPLIPALTGELFGLGHMGLLFAFITIGGGIGGAFGPLLAGYIHDARGSYSIAFLIAAALSAMSLVILPLLKAQYRTVHDTGYESYPDLTP